MLAMRRFRSFAAALLGALLLQATLLGSASACARVSGMADMRATSATAAAGHEAHDAHAAHGQAGRPAPDDAARRDSHGQAPAHCMAAMSCTMVGVASTGTTLPGARVVPVVRIAAHDDDAPASTRGAPEPPPPRA
jgi:hypothetical protein